jgi:hypothetical protein
VEQMVNVALKSRALAVPAKLQMEVASPLLSSSVAQQQPWWQQACKPIWSSTVQVHLVSSKTFKLLLQKPQFCLRAFVHLVTD